jgi:putative ATP-binding cassette transporter
MSNSIAVPNHPSAQGRRAPWRTLPALTSNWTAVAFFQDVWRLAQPYGASEEKWYARGMLALLLAIKLAAIYICVQQNEWYNSFHSSLQTNDIQAFFKQVGIFGLIAGSYTISLVSSHWAAESLKLRWRDWLVRQYTADWLSSRAYYRIQLEGRSSANPDQQIVEDLGLFAGQTLNLLVGFLDMSVSLIAFTSILWGLGGTITVAGVSVAGYMVFAVFGYALLASWITHRIGNPLAGLHSANQRLESEFRYGLVRLRENAETVAFYGGETQERRVLNERWHGVVENFWAMMRRERAMACFTHSYTQFSIIVPFLLAAPRYFAGQISFGQVMQVTAAFATVQGCLNYFINSYREIAHWRATTERLKTFRADLDQARASEHSSFVWMHAVGRIGVQDLHLSLPNGRALVSGVDLSVDQGKALLIRGPSGTGKSTVLRAIAGLWPYGRGNVSITSGASFFLPQRPYLPLGTLRQAIFYPAPARADDAEISHILRSVGLEHLIERLDTAEPWSQRLSGGEQQRLAFARVLLARPETVFLDEATSALDEEAERNVYSLLRNAEWKPTIVSIGHRSTLVDYHDETLDLKRAA